MKLLESRQVEFKYGFAVVVGCVLATNFSLPIGVAASVALAFFAKNRREGMLLSESARVAGIALLIWVFIATPAEIFRHLNWTEFKAGFAQAW
ncbi:MAG TPA: hypothetical protein VGM64_21030 [Lacunisphaera sp.]|jgi:hypothetical protein